MKKYDYRSEEANLYRPLYKGKAWQDLRRIVIRRDLGMCQICKSVCVTGRRGDPRLATVDHIVAHKGDLALFYDLGNLQLLCQTCHSGAKQSEEKAGFSRAVDNEGYPVDLRHPANKADLKR